MTEEELTRHQRAAETKRRRTREAVIQGALDLYGQAQDGDFTRDEIAEASGVGSATLHKNFGSKYDVLKAAYERLLSPLVGAIVEAQDAGISNPQDGMDELIRYVYTATRISYEHRALTTAMVRAYFELPPAQMAELFDGKQLPIKRQPVGAYLAVGRSRIFQLEPFKVGSVDFNHAAVAVPLSYTLSDTILMDLYYNPSETVVEEITRKVCRIAVRMILLENRDEDLDKRIERIQGQA